jgi:hypothetical protein
MSQISLSNDINSGLDKHYEIKNFHNLIILLKFCSSNRNLYQNMQQIISDSKEMSSQLLSSLASFFVKSDVKTQFYNKSTIVQNHATLQTISKQVQLI